MKPSEYIQKGWCQGSTAKDHEGKVCMSTDPTATQWCLIGAIGAAYHEHIHIRMVIAEKLESVLDTRMFSIWNDNPKRTKAEVIAVLQAIGE